MIRVNSAPVCPSVLKLLEWFDHPGRYVMILERPDPCQDLHRFCEENGSLMRARPRRCCCSSSPLSNTARAAASSTGTSSHRTCSSAPTPEIKLLDFGCGHLLKDTEYKEFAGWSGEALCGSLCFGLEAFELISCSSRVSQALFHTPLRSGLVPTAIVPDQLLLGRWVWCSTSSCAVLNLSKAHGGFTDCASRVTCLQARDGKHAAVHRQKSRPEQAEVDVVLLKYCVVCNRLPSVD